MFPKFFLILRQKKSKLFLKCSRFLSQFFSEFFPSSEIPPRFSDALSTFSFPSPLHWLISHYAPASSRHFFRFSNPHKNWHRDIPLSIMIVLRRGRKTPARITTSSLGSLSRSKEDLFSSTWRISTTKQYRDPASGKKPWLAVFFIYKYYFTRSKISFDCIDNAKNFFWVCIRVWLTGIL